MRRRHLLSQSGFQSCYGGGSLDQKLERIGKAAAEDNRFVNPPPAKNAEKPPWSALSIAYGFCILAGGFLGLACIALVFLRIPNATAATHLGSLGFAGLAFLALVLQMAVGFPLERTLDDNMAKQRQEIRQRQQLQGGPDFGDNLGVLGAGLLEVNYSFWLWLSCLVTFCSIPFFLGELGIMIYRFFRTGRMQLCNYPVDSLQLRRFHAAFFVSSSALASCAVSSARIGSRASGLRW